MATLYTNVTQQEGGVTSHYGMNGWTAQTTLIFDGVQSEASGTDIDTTLQTLMQSSDVPQRGEAHPSGLDMQVDEIEAKAITSSQMAVTVKYRKLSGLDQEPDDTKPGLLTMGSSVLEIETNTDATGAQMIAPYLTSTKTSGVFTGALLVGIQAVVNGANAPLYNITNLLNGSTISAPASVAIGKYQFPIPVYRFQRREKYPPASAQYKYMQKTNKSPMTIWGSLTVPTGSVLCTRIEGNTPDNGISYIVEYEFQYNPLGWQLAASYTLPNNTQGVLADGTNSNVLGPGDIPTDAPITYFTIYGAEEFNNLKLA